jgi:Choline/Carnitine o-acyltransferase
LTTPAEYAASEQAVKEFIAPGSVGEKLHNMLVEKGSKEENWVLNIYTSLL